MAKDKNQKLRIMDFFTGCEHKATDRVINQTILLYVSGFRLYIERQEGRGSHVTISNQM